LKLRVKMSTASVLPRSRSKYPRPECIRRIGPAGVIRPGTTRRAARCAAERARVIGRVHRRDYASLTTMVSEASASAARGLVGYSDGDYADTFGAFWAIHVTKAIIAQANSDQDRATTMRREGVIGNNEQPTWISGSILCIDKMDINGVSQRRNAWKSKGLSSQETRLFKGGKFVVKPIVAGRE